jgi:hypothetical protein
VALCADVSVGNGGEDNVYIRMLLLACRLSYLAARHADVQMLRGRHSRGRANTNLRKNFFVFTECALRIVIELHTDEMRRIDDGVSAHVRVYGVDSCGSSVA